MGPTSDLKARESSIKKCLALTRKLKHLTADQTGTLLRELAGCNLGRYVDESVAAIVEGLPTLKTTAALQGAAAVCRSLHTDYPDFSPALARALGQPFTTSAKLLAQLTSKKEEDQSGIGQGLRLLTLVAQMGMLDGKAASVLTLAAKTLALLVTRARSVTLADNDEKEKDKEKDRDKESVGKDVDVVRNRQVALAASRLLIDLVQGLDVLLLPLTPPGGAHGGEIGRGLAPMLAAASGLAVADLVRARLEAAAPSYSIPPLDVDLTSTTSSTIAANIPPDDAATHHASSALRESLLGLDLPRHQAESLGDAWGALWAIAVQHPPSTYLAKSDLRIILQQVAKVREFLKVETRRLGTDLRRLELRNTNTILRQGTLSVVTKNEYTDRRNELEKWIAATQAMSAAVGLPGLDVELVELEGRIEGEDGLVFVAKPFDASRLGMCGLWDNEDESQFFEDLLDLREVMEERDRGRMQQVEAVTVENEEDVEVTVPTKDAKDLRTRSEDDEELWQSDEEGPSSSKGKPVATATDPINKAKQIGLVERLLNDLPACRTSEQCDDWCRRFCHIESKGHRKRLVKVFSRPPRLAGSVEGTRAYARVIATLSRIWPDMGAMVAENVSRWCRGLTFGARQGERPVEARVRASRLLGALACFRLVSVNDVCATLIYHLRVFVRGNVDAFCALLETTARLLSRLPETQARLDAILALLEQQRQRSSTTVSHNELVLSTLRNIAHADKSSIPPRAPIPRDAAWIEYTLRATLADGNVRRALDDLWALEGWDDTSSTDTPDKVVRGLVETAATQGAQVEIVADLLVRLRRWRPDVVEDVIDVATEFVFASVVRGGADQQRRLALARLLGAAAARGVIRGPVVEAITAEWYRFAMMEVATETSERGGGAIPTTPPSGFVVEPIASAEFSSHLEQGGDVRRAWGSCRTLLAWLGTALPSSPSTSTSPSAPAGRGGRGAGHPRGPRGRGRVVTTVVRIVYWRTYVALLRLGDPATWPDDVASDISMLHRRMGRSSSKFERLPEAESTLLGLEAQIRKPQPRRSSSSLGEEDILVEEDEEEDEIDEEEDVEFEGRMEAGTHQTPPVVVDGKNRSVDTETWAGMVDDAEMEVEDDAMSETSSEGMDFEQQALDSFEADFAALMGEDRSVSWCASPRETVSSDVAGPTVPGATPLSPHVPSATPSVTTTTPPSGMVFRVMSRDTAREEREIIVPARNKMVQCRIHAESQREQERLEIKRRVLSAARLMMD